MSGKMTMSTRYRQTPENGTVTKRPWREVVLTAVALIELKKMA